LQSPLHPNKQFQERAGYFPVSGAHLYTVLHEAPNPVARVLLVGPFASERHNSYLPWVRRARSLAAENIEVLRYDYRGIGESTGVFEEMTFAEWNEDVRLLATWLADRMPHAPLLLHGLGLGAILAGRAFDEGIGEGLLLWSPPASANQALRATLMRWVGLEQIFKFGDDRKSSSDYIRKLERGSSLEVDGYLWTPSLCRDSIHCVLPRRSQTKRAPLSNTSVRSESSPSPAGPRLWPKAGWWDTTTRKISAGCLLPTGSGLRPSHRIPAGESPMRDAIETRELIVPDGLGDRLQGTFHRPGDRRFDSSSALAGKDRIGVLFLNSLSLPRAASGDSAVHWADSIAEHGSPSFRVDLPGLGDSEGQASTDLLDFINGGGFAPAAEAAVKQLVDRSELTGMVVFGHSAGSVSAVYAAAASSECKGLILLDPYFHLPLARRPRVGQELSDWARRSKLGTLFSNSYDRARNLLLKLRGSQPPGNANSALLLRWKHLATTGVPILILKAPRIKARAPDSESASSTTLIMLCSWRPARAGSRSSLSSAQIIRSPIARAVRRCGNTSKTGCPRTSHSQASMRAPREKRSCAPTTRAICKIRKRRLPTGVALWKAGMRNMDVGSEVVAQFTRVAQDQDKRLAPLTDELTLLDSGLDSLCFAIVVARLETTLGVDPFSDDEDARFPVTFGDFIRFYENAAK